MKATFWATVFLALKSQNFHLCCIHISFFCHHFHFLSPSFLRYLLCFKSWYLGKCDFHKYVTSSRYFQILLNITCDCVWQVWHFAYIACDTLHILHVTHCHTPELKDKRSYSWPVRWWTTILPVSVLQARQIFAVTISFKNFFVFLSKWALCTTMKWKRSWARRSTGRWSMQSR